MSISIGRIIISSASMCSCASQFESRGWLICILLCNHGVGRHVLYSHFCRFLRQFHGHLEHESRALVHTVRENVDLPTAVVYNLLTYSQTHAKSIRV